MTDQLKLPRALSEEPNPPKPLRPSHQKIIENLDRWANSSGASAAAVAGSNEST